MVSSSRIPAIKVKQWLPDWDVPFSNHRDLGPKPEKHFYVFSISAARLRRLSDAYRRGGDEEDGKPSAAHVDPSAIQRRHDPKRSREIRDFIRAGYPWSTLAPTKQNAEHYDSLRKPGWLPTAILVNVMKAGEKRRGSRTLAAADAVTIHEHTDGRVEVKHTLHDAEWS